MCPKNDTEKNNISESIAYYKKDDLKIIDSFSNKSNKLSNASNMRSLFYSNEPKINSINTVDVNNYLKQSQISIKLSDDPNINSIKNIKTDKFKNKYYNV
jgi:hypothetical protein